ncbi:protease Do-like 8, chloroplastic [Trifolium pratense]|uniref:protease Do-like 8, chloroplastic n=1 Tax=Trifolium pratense TaxID=57577 RepID=UPI001E6955D6|nr:protease Do-like 8, chloroplastic [Trifolium pratense]
MRFDCAKSSSFSYITFVFLTFIAIFVGIAGTSAGVGFAIPSSTVLRIVPQLIQFGKVVRAGLNVDIAPDLIANQLNVRNGALILTVPKNSLAAKVGLNPTTRGFAGNIVLRFS